MTATVYFFRRLGAGTMDGAVTSKVSFWTGAIFQSPFDKRAASEVDASAPISYGLNGNTKGGASGIAGYVSQQDRKSIGVYHVCPGASSGDNGNIRRRYGLQRVTRFTKIPDPAASGGTHNGRKQINALFADLHAETTPWSKFILDNDPNDPSAALRWDPYLGYP